MKSKPTNPTNFEEKLIKIRDELLTKVTEGIQLGEYILEALALDDFNEAISTLCEEEVKRAIKPYLPFCNICMKHHKKGEECE